MKKTGERCAYRLGGGDCTEDIGTSGRARVWHMVDVQTHFQGFMSFLCAMLA